jgi:CelD/BcsL family acetyltransferase involved in cellulose biosynthesis
VKQKNYDMRVEATGIADAGTKLSVVERYEECRLLAPRWNRIVECNSRGVWGLDVTATFEWCMMLWEAFLDKAPQLVVVAQRNGSLRGILPLYLSAKTVHGIRCQRLAPIGEIFSERSGFLLQDYSIDNLDTLLSPLWSGALKWDVFQCTLVAGSDSQVLFEEFVRQKQLRCERLFEEVCPYVELNRPWDEVVGSWNKRFRANLRKAKDRLDQQGGWQHQVYDSERDMHDLLSASREVEQDSWKAANKSSLGENRNEAAFYQQLIPVAAKNGWLSGHVLWHDREPVAYNFGLIFHDVFLSLKISYKNAWKKLSPGNMLKYVAIQELHRRGVWYYSMMGPADPHKLSWTDSSYTRNTYMVYNNTTRGTAAWVGGKLSQRVGRGGSQV